MKPEKSEPKSQEIPKEQTSFMLNNLIPGSEYQVRIQFYNQFVSRLKTGFLFYERLL